MEQERNPEISGQQDWLDDILPPTQLDSEIGPHESMESAGLTHPSDVDVERIIEETKADNWEEILEEEIKEDASQAASAAPTQALPATAQEESPAEDSTQGVWDEETKDRMTPEPFQDEEYREAFGEGADLAAVFAQPPAASQPENVPPEMPPSAEETSSAEAPKTPARKGRPRRKRGYGLLGIPHVLATVIWLAVVVAIGVSLGRLIWVCAADVLAFGREEHEVQITITDQDSIESIAQKLKNGGLIRYPQLFELYADLTNAQEDISPGTYTLNTIYDYHALVNAMTFFADSREVVEITVPEGYNCRQIFALLEEENVCTAAELEEYAATGELDEYWFLEDVERGDKYCLEGFLFPDTYEFYTNDEPGRVIDKFLAAFDNRFTDKMKEQLVTLNERLADMMADNGYDQDYIDANLFSVRDMVTVASMVQKETASISEAYLIASVIYNRLTNQAEYPFLNIDATVVYALGGKDGPLTQEDLAVDSPYNTYVHTGLIPGPICNPGRQSMYAALDPEDTNYHYYAYDPSAGEHHFSETSSGHQEFLDSLEESDG